MTAALQLCHDSDRERWLELRMDGIGASDAPQVLGRSSFGGPARVAAVKLGFEFEDNESELMKWGRLVETPMLEAFTEETGIPASIDGNLYRHSNPNLAFMQATLDGQAVVDGRTGGVECKLAFWSADAWDDGVPDQVQIQVQHQLAVMDYDFAFVLALLGGYRFRWAKVERDSDFIENVLVPTERDFWTKVQSGEAVTPAGAPDAEFEALKLMFPDTVPGKVARIEGDDMIETFEKWKTCTKERGVLDKAAKSHRNVLIQAVGDAEFGELDNGQRISLKSQTRKEFVTKESTFRVLRAAK